MARQHGRIGGDLHRAGDGDDHEPHRVIGAKNAETRAVPCDCTENRAIRITTVSGST